MIKNILSTAGIAAAVIVSAATFSSCGSNPDSPGLEYMPDMYRSPSYETNSPNPVFRNKMTSQLPVEGTVPVGHMPFVYPMHKEGYEAAGKEFKIPADLMTDANKAEGKRLYEAYCIYCHGGDGNGGGPVVDKGFPAPPSYSKGKSSRGGDMKDLSSGKIYHTIYYGLNLMGSHASQLSHEERVKIVMYVHELQKGGASTAAAAPADSASAGQTEASAGSVKSGEEKIKP